jgi:hypothetical protein
MELLSISNFSPKALPLKVAFARGYGRKLELVDGEAALPFGEVDGRTDAETES